MSLLRAPAPTPTTLLNQKRTSPILKEPDSLITPPASITKSIASRYSQIHNQENTSVRTAGTRVQIQVDFNRGLWGFCLSNKQVVGNCWMPGACYDQDKCKDGCGFLDRKDLSTALCSSQDSSGSTIQASVCVNAYLTLDNGLGPFQRIDCGWTTGKSHYTASQADAVPNPAATTTSSSSSLANLSSPPTPSETDSNGGGNNNSANIGAIVGGVIGGLAIICAFVFAAYLVWAYRVRDRRRKQAAHNINASELLNRSNNGDGSGRSSSSSSPSEDDDTPSMTTNLHLSDSPDSGQGGTWGRPRELESGFERGGYAHEQQGLQSGGSHEVLSVEKLVEMPVKIEPVEMSSGWEDHSPGIRRYDGREGGGYGHEMSR